MYSFIIGPFYHNIFFLSYMLKHSSVVQVLDFQIFKIPVLNPEIPPSFRKTFSKRFPSECDIVKTLMVRWGLSPKSHTKRFRF